MKRRLLVLLTGFGCSLIVEDPEAPLSRRSCDPSRPVAELLLSNTAPLPRGFVNYVGQRKFTAHDGRGGVLTPDGRFVALDLSNPEAPVIGPSDLDLGEGTEWHRLEISGARTVLLGAEGGNGVLRLIDRAAPANDHESVVPVDAPGESYLSLTPDCVFASARFSEPHYLRIGRPAAVSMTDEPSALALGRSGLGTASVRIVQVESDATSCRFASPAAGFLSFEDVLAAATSERLWLIRGTNLLAVAADGRQEYALSVDGSVVDVAVPGDLLLVAAQRDLLVYRRRAPGTTPDPERTIPLTGRALGLAPLFDDAPRWVAVLVARETIESSPAMSVVIYDVEACP